jgi:hypothetical protein
MNKALLLLILLISLLLGYGMHKLIRRLINPRSSVNHLFLFFLAHFIGILTLCFFISLLIIKFKGFLFPT